MTTQKSHHGAPTDQRIASRTAKWDSGGWSAQEMTGKRGGEEGGLAMCLHA